MTAVSQSASLTALSTASLVQTWQETGAYYELTSAWLAETLFCRDQEDEALKLAQSVLAHAQASDSRWFLYNAHATLGMLYTQLTPANTTIAETHWSAALQQAETMHSPPFIVQCSLALGSLLKRQITKNKEHEHRETVARARSYLTQAVASAETIGLTTDRKNAQTLLAELPSI